jgi:phosphoglycolate phosphatase-like HAD superfamily hydrolase
MPIARSLFVESKKLRVFDFDDSIVTTTSYIYVNNEKTGKKFRLTPGEYAVYEPKVGDEFDFSDFQKVQNPKLIKGYFEILRRMAAKVDGDRRVYILTARGAYKPVHKFIKDSGIRNVYVVALGDANPEKKADWIEDKVKEGYDDVFFVDDSQKNIDAVKKRLRAYPNVKQKIQLVKHSGSKNENVTIKLMNIL